jgi:hypothetical protein
MGFAPRKMSPSPFSPARTNEPQRSRLFHACCWLAEFPICYQFAFFCGDSGSDARLPGSARGSIMRHIGCQRPLELPK